MNLRCAIVDDEPLALGLLESYIKKTPFLELSGSYSSAIQAMKYLPDHPVDVLFWISRCLNSTGWSFHAWYLKTHELFSLQLSTNMHSTAIG